MDSSSSSKPGKPKIDPDRWRSRRPGSIDKSGDMALLATYLATISFLTGIFAPCFKMVPRLGSETIEGLAKLFLPDPHSLDPKQFSLAGGIRHLFQDGDVLIASVLLLFTVLFPLAKLATLFTLAHAREETAHKLVATLAHLGKWSMLDVLVMALIVIAFKGFPGGSHVEILWGLYLFSASVILSMIATILFKKHFGRAHA